MRGDICFKLRPIWRNHGLVGYTHRPDGLDDLVIIEGGMLAWEGNGLPVARSQSVMNWTAEHRKKMVAIGVVTDLCVTAAPY